MFPKLTLLSFLLLYCAGWAEAQNPNPFELLWRKDGAGTVKMPSSVVADVTVAELPAEVIDTIVTPVEESPPPPPTAVIPPVDTMASSAVAMPGAEENLAEPEPRDGVGPAVPRSMAPESTVKTNPILLVLIFGVIFSLLAWGLSLNRVLLRNIYRAALNENLSSLLYREQRFATTQYLYYTIYLIFFINGGMFLYFLGQYFDWTSWTFSSVWACIGIVTLVYVLRHLTLSILGSTYPVSKEMTHFSFSILLHNILLGVALIPVNLLLAFGPDGLYKLVVIAGILICLVIYLARQFRGLLITTSLISGNFFHFFIYLCAVEILPLLTLVKFFHN